MRSIPMTLVCGFLGAGKSTLINHLLQAHPAKRFGLVVNEFGEIPLESEILEAKEDSIVELPHGCMCCVVRDDLAKTVSEFLDKNPTIDHLLLEASGLSDPFPIAQTFLTDTLGDRVRFDAIVAVVDAQNFESTLKDFTIALKQLRLADFVVLTKTDTASQESQTRVRHQVGIFAPKIPILDASDPALASLLVETHSFDHLAIQTRPLAPKARTRSIMSPGATHAHTKPNTLASEYGANKDFTVAWEVQHEAVDTLVYTATQPFDFVRLNAVLDNLPPGIVRAKGFLWMNTHQSVGAKTIIQMVSHRSSLDLKPWGIEEARQSALVFIGRQFDVPGLQLALDKALCSPEEVADFMAEIKQDVQGPGLL